MTKIVFDSSAILALLKMESGHEIVSKNLEQAVVSSVNFCEVVSFLSKKTQKQDEMIKFLTETFDCIEDFNIEQAIIAGSFINVTKDYGLSLGDRACLALAKYKNIPVLTADKAWSKLNLGIKIKLIRS
jgi:PIN domain nuclease of toxin-antitoxin system